MSTSINEDLKFFIANQAQSFAEPLLSVLLDQRNAADRELSAAATSGRRCRQELVQLSAAALKGQQWALKIFDSNGRLQSGMASGSLYSLLGNFEQCVASQNETTFCLAHIAPSGPIELPFEGYNNNDDRQQQLLQSSVVKFGFCAPASCDLASIEPIARHLLNTSRWLSSLSLTNIECHQSPDLEAGVWRTSSILSVLLLVATLVAFMMATMLQTSSPKSAPHSNENSSPSPSSKSRRNKSQQQTNKWTATTRFNLAPLLLLALESTALSLRRNANKLLQKRKQSHQFAPATNQSQQQQQLASALSVLDGLRVVSTIWIIIIHSYNFAFQWLWFDNHFRAQTVYQSIWLQWIANGTYSIDNFLIISGFLANLKQLTAANSSGVAARSSIIIRLVVGRYLRLVPIMLVVILFSVALFPWVRFVSFNMANTSPMFGAWCEKNWPLNAMLLQNWISSSQMCLGHAWFVAVDFQLMLAMQLLQLGLVLSANSKDSRNEPNESSRRTQMLASLVGVMVVGQLVSALLVYTEQLQAMPVIAAESLSKLYDYFRLVYIKPHYWLSSYAIGMLLALLVLDGRVASSRRPGARARAWSRSSNGSSWGASLLHLLPTLAPILVLVLVLFSLFPYFFPPNRMSRPQASLYVLLARPLWSASVAFLLYQLICWPKRDIIIRTLRRLLGARLWLPLSRLSYLAYLLHPILMALLYGSATSPVRYSSPLFVYLAVGNIVLTFALAFVFHLLFELPLRTMLLRATDKITHFLAAAVGRASSPAQRANNNSAN